MPRVSVLMGIYNCANTLEEAVDCIINQTFTDWAMTVQRIIHLKLQKKLPQEIQESYC